MRWIVWILLIFSAAVGLAMLMRFNHGNVAVFWPPYRLDLSVNMAVLILLLMFAAIHLALLGLSKALDLPSRVRNYQSQRKQRRAMNAMRDSILAFFEGRFGRAERLAEHVSGDAGLAGPAALIAARAAHKMREFERRDKWLASAQVESNTHQAYLVTAAELAVEEQNGSQALSHVRSLHGRGARHIHTLRLAMRAHEQNEEWESVLQVVRQLAKRDALPLPAVQGIQLRAARGLFKRHKGDLPALKRDWSGLTAHEKTLPDVLESAVAAMTDAGDHEFAWRLIEQGLKLGASPNLLQQFRELKGIPARERLLRAEGWRTRMGDDPALMLTLAHLCAEESLWGKGEEFYKLACKGPEAAQAHYGLAMLYEQIGRLDEANSQFRFSASVALHKTGPEQAPNRVLLQLS